MTMSDLYFAIGLSALFFAIFGAIEATKRRFGLSAEYTRRVAHIAAGFLVLLDYAVLSKLVFALLLASGIVTFLILTRLGLMTSVHAIRRKSKGAEILTLGFLAAFAITIGKPEAFIPTVLVLTLADPIAGLVGQLNKHETKSLIGSATFFIVAATVLALSTGIAWWAVALVALSATIVERFTPLGFDNLTIPVATAGLLLLF